MNIHSVINNTNSNNNVTQPQDRTYQTRSTTRQQTQPKDARVTSMPQPNLGPQKAIQRSVHTPAHNNRSTVEDKPAEQLPQSFGSTPTLGPKFELDFYLYNINKIARDLGKLQMPLQKFEEEVEAQLFIANINQYEKINEIRLLAAAIFISFGNQSFALKNNEDAHRRFSKALSFLKNMEAVEKNPKTYNWSCLYKGMVYSKLGSIEQDAKNYEAAPAFFYLAVDSLQEGMNHSLKTGINTSNLDYVKTMARATGELGRIEAFHYNEVNSDLCFLYEGKSPEVIQQAGKKKLEKAIGLLDSILKKDKDDNLCSQYRNEFLESYKQCTKQN